jgi:hypothetical protein
MYRYEHCSEIERIGHGKNQQETYDRRQHRARMLEGPSSIEQETHGEPKHVSTNVRERIAPAEQPLAKKDSE